MIASRFGGGVLVGVERPAGWGHQAARGLARAWVRACVGWCWVAAAAIALPGEAAAHLDSGESDPAGVSPASTEPLSAGIEMATQDWTVDRLHAWWRALSAERPDAVAAPELPAELTPPLQDSAWRSTSLPQVRRAVGQEGGLPVRMHWYRLPRSAASSERLALFVPRWVGLSATVLWHDGQTWRVLAHSPPARREIWAQPLWVPLPGAAAQEGSLVIAIASQAGTLHVMSSAVVGPYAQLEPRWERRVWFQTGAPQAISLTIAVMGLFALVLWFRNTHEPAYLWFALGSAAWTMRSLHHFVEMPGHGAVQQWFWWATHASLGWVVGAVMAFVLRLQREPAVRTQRLVLGLLGAAGVLSLPVLGTSAVRPEWLYLAAAVAAVVVGSQLIWLAWRKPQSELRVIAVVFCMALVFAAHDLAVSLGWAWPQDFFLLPFAALAILVSFLYAVQRRYAGAVEQALFANSQLQQSLDVQADAIQLQHERLREAERQQALLLERQRLMADMHDGLGSSLLSALVAVEQGSMSQDQVVEVLRECVDDLRLVIDSLEPVGHDLVSLLATMRYRLGKRLQASGLKLEWDVQDLPPLTWLEPPDALHVLRLMQEGLNNVLKHAHASRVRMATRDHGSHVEIRLEDDGAGFDVHAIRQGRGLKSQLKRAQRLGGKLRIDSTPGVGTRLSLRLPVERPEDPGRAPLR